MLNWLDTAGTKLDSFGLVPTEVGAVEKQITELKVCQHLLPFSVKTT